MANPGRYRHQGQIQQKVVTGQNASGEDIYTWGLVHNIYFSKEPLQGNEALRVQQIWAEARDKVSCAYISGVTHAMRLIWWDGSANHTLEILDVQTPTGIPLETVMYCREWAE